MPHLALYTFGTLKAPLLDPGRLTREFHESVQAIYGGVGQRAGYIAHADPIDPSAGAQFDWDWGKCLVAFVSDSGPQRYAPIRRILQAGTRRANDVL